MTRTVINLTSRRALIPKDVDDKKKFESNWDAIFGKKLAPPEAPPINGAQLPTSIGVNT